MLIHLKVCNTFFKREKIQLIFGNMYVCMYQGNMFILGNQKITENKKKNKNRNRY